MNRRRLLIVNPEYPPIGGGAGSASRFLARELSQQGHRVTVLTSSFGDYHGYSRDDRIGTYRVSTRRVRADQGGLHQMLLFAISALRHAPAIVRRERIDAVIAFFSLPSGLIGLRLKRKCQIPFVVSLRGADVPGVTTDLAAAHFALRPVRRSVLKGAHRVVANSPGLAKLSRAGDPFPVGTIPNGVDCRLFHPRRPTTPPSTEPFRILFAGRLQHQKNLSFVLEQLAVLADQSSNRFELRVAGDGPLRPRLEQLANKLGLNDRVEWKGWVSQAALARSYRRADCLVNTSKYEGLPNTVLEAMASGLPVVASRVVGNESAVQHGQTGILFAPGGGQEFRVALDRLANDRQMAHAMGQKGRRTAIELYSWESVAKAYLQLFVSTPRRRD